jgi:hypothetical protein
MEVPQCWLNCANQCVITSKLLSKLIGPVLDLKLQLTTHAVAGQHATQAFVKFKRLTVSNFVGNGLPNGLWVVGVASTIPGKRKDG